MSPAGFEKVENVTGYMSGAKITRLETNGRDVVILGEVDPEDQTHNCDQMGCGWEHVLVRLFDTTEEAQASGD